MLLYMMYDLYKKKESVDSLHEKTNVQDLQLYVSAETATVSAPNDHGAEITVKDVH